MKGQKKSYVIIHQETKQFVCKGNGGVGWAFTDDFKKAVKFVFSKAETMEQNAKFSAKMIHIDNFK